MQAQLWENPPVECDPYGKDNKEREKRIHFYSLYRKQLKAKD